MLGRTASEVVSNYVDTIQRAVSCVSDSVVSVRGGYYVTDISHTLVMNRGNPVRLSGTSGGILNSCVNRSGGVTSS